MTRHRNTAACDACRARKVKATLGGLPDLHRVLQKWLLYIITANAASKASRLTSPVLGARWTPRKKRGPKNRYIQTLRDELDGMSGGRPSLGDFAPPEIIHQLIADWFGRIHPVAPILHQDRFMQQLRECLVSGNGTPSFLLLVASLCAATMASLRRRRHLYGSVTVESCLDFAERLGLWSPSAEITVERSLAVYNFGSAVHHEHGIESPLAHRLVTETAMSVRFLMHQAIETMCFADAQILKRLYWLVYAGHCTYDMYGWQLLFIRQAHDHTHTLIPLEISDAQLMNDGEPSSPDHIGAEYSYVPGLNALSRLYMVWQSSQAVATQSIANLQAHIERTHRLAEDLSPELSWKGNDHVSEDFGFDVQMVNLKITQLHIRSNLLEQMNTVARSEGLLITPHAIIEERHRVVDELLDILYHMPTEVFDANGHSIIPKIRDIGSALLDELRTGSQGRTLQASVNLDRLLAKLQNLDLRPANATPF
ncbi:hypothetical protein OPT61_g9033 [Boeremia exigua]|uniref:Uncharacterized protein n=1 Tax=Boeremia exigua TaxID=749465 RepID=A0ACC2HVS9_9PLEO|nr:hypothetical protein OPT61_g9033 [Boeremia exigua]